DKIDAEKSTVTISRGKLAPFTVTVNDSTKITLDGKDAKLADLAAGQTIAVSCDRKAVATKVVGGSAPISGPDGNAGGGPGAGGWTGGGRMPAADARPGTAAGRGRPGWASSRWTGAGAAGGWRRRPAGNAPGWAGPAGTAARWTGATRRPRTGRTGPAGRPRQ